jgi:predicted dehydrogenase
VDDYWEILFYYKELRVRLKSSYVVREPLPGYILHGMNGSFIKAKTDVQENTLKEGVLPGKSDWGTEPESEKGLLHAAINGKVVKKFVESEQGNYGEYYDAIYDSIRNGAPLPVTAEEGLQVIRIIEDAFKSNELKKVIPA